MSSTLQDYRSLYKQAHSYLHDGDTLLKSAASRQGIFSRLFKSTTGGVTPVSASGTKLEILKDQLKSNAEALAYGEEIGKSLGAKKYAAGALTGGVLAGTAGLYGASKLAESESKKQRAHGRMEGAAAGAAAALAAPVALRALQSTPGFVPNTSTSEYGYL